MDFGAILKTLVPWIGAAIGGPAAPLISMGIQAAASALGLSEPEKQTLESVQKAFAGATPEQMLALKQADNDFAVKMQQLGFEHVVDLEKLAADDRDSARRREEVIKDHTPRVLAYLVTGGFFGLLGFLATSVVPPASASILNVMVGSLGTSWVGIITYYFGSSAGSAKKTELLAAAPAVPK